MKHILPIIIAPIIIAIALILPIVSAYDAGIPIMDLWTLFVENVFGGFFISVIGFVLIFAIIMGIIGQMSAWSIMVYNTMFVLTMFIGYGYSAFVILAASGIMLWSIFQVIRWWNGASWY